MATRSRIGTYEDEVTPLTDASKSPIYSDAFSAARNNVFPTGYNNEEYQSQIDKIQSNMMNKFSDLYGRPRQETFTAPAAKAAGQEGYDQSNFFRTMLGDQWRDKIQRLGANGTSALFSAMDKDREASFAGRSAALEENRFQSEDAARRSTTQRADALLPYEQASKQSENQYRTALGSAALRKEARDDAMLPYEQAQKKAQTGVLHAQESDLLLRPEAAAAAAKAAQTEAAIVGIDNRRKENDALVSKFREKKIDGSGEVFAAIINNADTTESAVSEMVRVLGYNNSDKMKSADGREISIGIALRATQADIKKALKDPKYSGLSGQEKKLLEYNYYNHMFETYGLYRPKNTSVQ